MVNLFVKLARVICLQVVVLLSVSLSISPALAQEIDTAADYAVLMDYETGTILFQKDADTLMAPASMSKLMTLEILFSRLREGSVTLDQEFHISTEAWRRGGAGSGSSTMFAEWNSWISVEDLIRGVTVVSANDACIAIAEALAGSEEDFARLMTVRARELGLEQSTFANSTGWPHPEQLMTARELALLARHLIQTYPEYMHYFAEEEYSWNGYTQPNRNPLLYRFPGADGLKTGHTEASGYGIVGTATRDDRRVIVVVNGLSSNNQRSSESRRLMTLGFNSFRSFELFTPGEFVGSAEVWLGREARVPLTVRDDVAVILRRDSLRDMRVTINYNGPVSAPIITGAELATLRVEAPGMETIEYQLYAATSMPRAGLYGQMITALDHLVTNIFTDPEEEPVASNAPIQTDITPDTE